MAISMTLKQYLADQDLEYEVFTHPPTITTTETSEASHVTGDCVAKGVVVKTGGGYLLAVLPASRRISFDMLEQSLHQGAALASEEETRGLFADCELGAIPPVGGAYRLPVLLDEALAGLPDVYFEAGDHVTLIHMRGDSFRRMLGTASQARFSVRG